MSKLTRFITGLLFMAMASTQLHCGSGPTVDTFDPAALTVGSSHSLMLKFWMKERGLKGDDLVPNLHFDDGKNQRVVFWVGEAVAAKVDALVQGKTYKVTFTFEGGDELFKGTATAIE
jgi:hypothetical protein